MTTWRCPIITEMGMCPETGIECPVHDPQCPHLPDELRPQMPTIKPLEGEPICCPRCGDPDFKLRKVRLSDRMLASARLDVVCINCGYRESLYKIGEEK